MPTRDHLAITRTAVESVLDKTAYQNYEIIIVDNGSVEERTLNWFKHIQADDNRVRVLRDDRPFNYSALNNNAVKYANGDYLVLLNNDIEVISRDWLSEMLALAQRDNAGCIGAKLYYPDGRIQHAGVVIGLTTVANHPYNFFAGHDYGYFSGLKFRRAYTAVTAACLLVSKEIFNKLGGLNENDLQIAYNDVDFCLKVAKAGYQNAWTPYAELTHHESISRGYEDTPEKRARFQKEAEYMIAQWKTNTFVDPAYNINLTKDRSDYSFGPPIWKV
jgi:GT2 family glycosyltransferase